MHIVCLLCLYVAKKKHKDKITLNLIQHEYVEYCKNTNQDFKINLLQLKKRLEELRNSNIITLRSDEKLNDLYELKASDEQVKDFLDNLYKDSHRNNFDEKMHEWLKKHSAI